MTPKEHIEALLKESDRVSTDIRQLESMVDKFIGFGITIIVAGFAYGLSAHLNEMFFVLPIALFGIYYIFFERMRTILWLGAYKRALEDKINEISETPIVNWEFLIQEHRGRVDVIVFSTNTVYFMILIGIIGFSLLRLNDDPQFGTQIVFGIRIISIYTAIIVFLAILLALCIWHWATVYRPAYDLSRRAIGVVGPRHKSIPLRKDHLDYTESP